MVKKKDDSTATQDEGSGLTSSLPEDGQSGVTELKESSEPRPGPPDPTRRPSEGDTVVYVPHVTNDNVGAGHCKAEVVKANADGTVDLLVHGPNGQFTVTAVDRGSDQTQRSYYWGEPDATEEGRGEAGG